MVISPEYDTVNGPIRTAALGRSATVLRKGGLRPKEVLRDGQRLDLIKMLLESFRIFEPVIKRAHAQPDSLKDSQ